LCERALPNKNTREMDWLYRAGRLSGRFIFLCTMRVKVIRPEMLRPDDACLVACTHLSHLDPFLLGVLMRRPVDWMARVEFYRARPIKWLLNGINAFAVRRFGVPVSAIRTGLKRLEAGRVVGICPEGGVTQGADACIRGGPIKRGVCLLSYRTGAPVLPVVLLGSDKLNCVAPWLPFKHARIWVAFGDRLIRPRRDLDRKTARRVMAEELQAEYQKLYAELLNTCALDANAIP